MNFFNVGVVLCSLSFNLNGLVNYVVKLVGCLALLLGIKEIGFLTENFGTHKRGVLLSAALCVFGSVSAVLSSKKILGVAASNVVCSMLGILTAAACFAVIKAILRQILKDKTLVNDTSLAVRADKTFNKLVIFAAASFVCDILTRVFSSGNVYIAAGVVFFFSRIIMYIYVISFGLSFNRVRMDHNIMHPIDREE